MARVDFVLCCEECRKVFAIKVSPLVLLLRPGEEPSDAIDRLANELRIVAHAALAQFQESGVQEGTVLLPRNGEPS